MCEVALILEIQREKSLHVQITQHYSLDRARCYANNDGESTILVTNECRYAIRGGLDYGP